MDLQVRKQNILNYIMGSIDKEYFDFYSEVSLKFDSYEEFVKYQTNIVDNANSEQIRTLEFLQKLITPNAEKRRTTNLNFMDKEDMLSNRIYGFIYGKDGKFIFIGHD